MGRVLPIAKTVPPIAKFSSMPPISPINLIIMNVNVDRLDPGPVLTRGIVIAKQATNSLFPPQEGSMQPLLESERASNTM